MKCINKKISSLILLSAAIFVIGCGDTTDQPVYKDAYQIYETSQKYQIIAGSDTSSQDTLPFFASGLCVSDGGDLGTDATHSYVAQASGVFNLATQEITYSQNLHQRIFPASTTKILTAYVALKYGNLDSVMTASENAANQASDSSVCGLKTGDQMSLRQLMYGLIMRSGNDAAIAIAEGISGDVESFVNLMNQEAKALGATNSNFVNPHGLQDENHYTSVYDMYLFLAAAMKQPEFMELIQCTSYTVDYIDSAGMPLQQVWTSTNKYLMGTEDIPEGVTVLGGKTGTTNDAGYCLVLLSNNASKQPIASIVMKADCRNNLYFYMNELLNGFAN